VGEAKRRLSRITYFLFHLGEKYYDDEIQTEKCDVNFVTFTFVDTYKKPYTFLKG